MQNSDTKCFLYAILAYLKRNEITQHRYRMQKYIPYLSELKYNDNDLPMIISGIFKFERENPQLAINVIKYTPLSATEMMNAMRDEIESDAEDGEELFEHDASCNTEEVLRRSRRKFFKHPCLI